MKTHVRKGGAGSRPAAKQARRRTVRPAAKRPKSRSVRPAAHAPAARPSKRTVVVYYTRYGTTAVVAREIARELGAELREIRAKRRHSWPVMGFSAVFNIRHRIELMDFDFSRCGLVVLCSPIWASKPACPVMSFLDAAKLDDTRSALLFTAWSRETGRIAEAMKGILQRRGSRLVASESLLIRRVPEETLRTQAREFALELKKKH